VLICRYTWSIRDLFLPDVYHCVLERCCCRSSKHGTRHSDRERSGLSSQHHVHSPAHSAGRSPNTRLDLVHRESPATSPRTRHVMSPGMSARTRHGTVYRSRSPDEYKKSRDDLVKWTIGSDYDTSQQQHSASQVLLPLLLLLILLLFCLFNQHFFGDFYSNRGQAPQRFSKREEEFQRLLE